MGLRRLRTTRSATDIAATEVVSGKDTLIAALETVLIESRGCSLDPESLTNAQEAFALLEERLQFTPLQSMVIAMLIDHAGPLSTKNMAHYLDTRNMHMITHMPEIGELVDRRIVRKVKDMDGEIQYVVIPAAAQAYMRNVEYIAPTDEGLSLAEFFERIDDLFTQCDDKLMEATDLHSELGNLIQKNTTLSVCKCIAQHRLDDQVLFLYCCREYVNSGDTRIVSSQYRILFERKSWGHISSGISSGSNPLLKEQLLEYHSKSDLMGNTTSLSPSSEVRQQLSEELGLAWETDDTLDHCAGLLSHKDIVGKSMYYNPTEREAIDKLRQLLQPDQFEAIQHRLAESGMRRGFACLFFGAPGTGKTETALQLAKATGRDIMQVNITDIKSKWVGESEQNVKKLFKRYRKLCAKSSKAPILLFNEADAIIGTRMEHVSRSVDKMENALQNIILEEMEQLDGILIATTNLTCNMDKAFERRFLYKVEFARPSLEARQSIWQSMIPTLSTDEAYSLASEYSLSGGQIENIARKRMVDYILYDQSASLDTLRTYCDSESLEHIQRKHPVVGFR